MSTSDSASDSIYLKSLNKRSSNTLQYTRDFLAQGDLKVPCPKIVIKHMQEVRRNQIQWIHNYVLVLGAEVLSFAFTFLTFSIEEYSPKRISYPSIEHLHVSPNIRKNPGKSYLIYLCILAEYDSWYY